MKKILLILLLFPLVVSGQSTYKILADSTRFGSVNNTGNELIIQNDTRDSTSGVLTNVQTGRTNFQKLRLQQVTDSSFRLLLGTQQQGQTITISGVAGGSSGRKVDTMYYNVHGDSLVFLIEGSRYALYRSPGITEQSYLFENTLSDVGGYYQAVAAGLFVDGTQGDTTVSVNTTADLLVSFVTNTGFPAITTIPAGTIHAHYETKKASGANNYYTYFELYKRSAGGVETLLLTSDNSSQSAVNTLIQNHVDCTNPTDITLLLTDILVVKVYAVMVSSSANITVYWDSLTNSGLTIPASISGNAQVLSINGDTLFISSGNYVLLTDFQDVYNASNGLRKSGDTIYLGGRITKPITTLYTGDSAGITFLVDSVVGSYIISQSAISNTKTAFVATSKTSAGATIQIGATTTGGSGDNKLIEFSTLGAATNMYIKGLPTDNSAILVLSKKTDSSVVWRAVSSITTDTTYLSARINEKTNKLLTFYRKTASDTLDLVNADGVVEMNVGSANNLSVPANADVAFPIGTQILVAQYGAGQTTIVALSGVTIRSHGGALKLTGQYASASLIKVGTNEWYLFGTITP